MGRLLALAMLLSLCSGCKNRPAALDPFLGRTKVPAPPTGSVGAQPPGAWNYPAAPPTLNTSTTGSSIYSPPGGFNSNNSTGATPPNPFTTPAQPATVNPSSTPARFTGTSGAAPIAPSSIPSNGVSGGQSIRIVEPSAMSTPSASAGNSGTYTGAARGGVDIMDLPVAGRTSQPKTAEGAGRATQQSYTQPAAAPSAPISSGIDPATVRNSTLPGQEPAFGFDAAYSQLNGRLEYSAADSRWILRYVEPGQRPDQVGGVVVLSPTSPVNGFRNGDFVSVRGRLEAGGGGTSLPSYTAASVTPQRDRR
ncbi:MAG: hypothetical protein K8U03_04725 [Planctomycetia bacterium]|nr:hypothetical protein [Planctomycetia bacterium]